MEKVKGWLGNIQPFNSSTWGRRHYLNLRTSSNGLLYLTIRNGKATWATDVRLRPEEVLELMQMLVTHMQSVQTGDIGADLKEAL